MPSREGDRDGRPKLTAIDDPIAEDTWAYEGTGGQRKTMRVVVGRPAPLPEQEWFTPIVIEGFTSGVASVLGVGPVDSLMNAMTLARSAFGKIHRLPGEGQEDLAETMTWVAEWYRRQCDGEWEHELGLVLETLDNPGWCLKVDLAGTALADLSVPDRVLSSFGTSEQGHPIDVRWLRREIRAGQYISAGDPDRLIDLFIAFRAWAMKVAPPEGDE